MIRLDQFRKIIPYAGPRAGVFLGPLNDAMSEFGIDTPARQAAFLAQIAHESGSLRYLREIADGRAYEGRTGLGNTEPGDGPRFKGRGLIQITGRANYRSCSVALYGDEDTLLRHPELLEDVVPACRSAAWFWWFNGLNSIADAGDFRKITRIVNGGVNGYNERLAYYQRAQTVLA
ncbi:glycoside hydrolase family 19 protein [Rhodocyclus purpureus]|uniref:glycoside hydrolase family 19 protein n=1 Tax=Rhodocyclus purpureus TaxID=1067 RepID=UPI001914096D|nr:glycoside hydrolase family 19 protein [Rhodocyclus purpureus]MBK5914576.1 chitinase [Rhodocyclus purpureus]